MKPSIRDAAPADLDAVLELNNRNAPMVGAVDAAKMRWFLDACPYFRVVVDDDSGRDRTILGFLVAMTPDVDYGSGNFGWFRDRGPADFLYIDRVATAEAARRAGVARLLYGDVEREARERGLARLTCEVNVRPRNDVSLMFHERMGFHGIEERETEYGPRVLMLEKPMAPPHERS